MWRWEEGSEPGRQAEVLDLVPSLARQASLFSGGQNAGVGAGREQVPANLPGMVARPESQSGQNHQQEGLAACGGLWSQAGPWLMPGVWKNWIVSTEVGEAAGCPGSGVSGGGGFKV